MDNVIKKNLIVVGLTIVSLIIGVLALKIGLDYAFKVLEKSSDAFATRIVPRLRKYKHTRVILELLFLIVGALFLVINGTGSRFYVVPIFIIYIFINTSVIYHLNKKSPEMFSLLTWIADRTNTKNYFINRLGLFLNQGASILFLLAALQVTYSFFAQLQWPNPFYYVAYLALPLYLNLWIYITYKARIRRDEDVINIRRLIAYLCLTIYTFVDGYIRFESYFGVSKPQTEPSFNFFLLISSLIFIGLERFLKALTDDYRSYIKR